MRTETPTDRELSQFSVTEMCMTSTDSNRRYYWRDSSNSNQIILYISRFRTKYKYSFAHRIRYCFGSLTMGNQQKKESNVVGVFFKTTKKKYNFICFPNESILRE